MRNQPYGVWRCDFVLAILHRIVERDSELGFGELVELRFTDALNGAFFDGVNPSVMLEEKLCDFVHSVVN